MRIFVTGTRGIPDIPGGVERHCEELYPRLAAMGHEVVVCTRSCYVTRDVAEEPLVNVFLPTTPNPTSGYFLLVPRQDVQVLDIRVGLASLQKMPIETYLERIDVLLDNQVRSMQSSVLSAGL